MHTKRVVVFRVCVCVFVCVCIFVCLCVYERIHMLGIIRLYAARYKDTHIFTSALLKETACWVKRRLGPTGPKAKLNGCCRACNIVPKGPWGTHVQVPTFNACNLFLGTQDRDEKVGRGCKVGPQIVHPIVAAPTYWYFVVPQTALAD